MQYFVLFVYQPGCVNSANFEKVLDEFIEKTPIAKVLGSYPKGEF